jgi:hypothetical protein
MPGDGRWQRVSWPLKTIFVTTFLAGIIGLLWLRIGNWTDSISWILLGISIAAALMLLVPSFADFVRNGAITGGLDRITECLRSVATASGLSAVATQLEPTGPICKKLADIEKKIDGRLDNVEKRLDQFSTLLGDRTARLQAVKAQLGEDGAIQKAFQTINSAQDDATKIKGVASLQNAVDELRRNMREIN